MTPRGSTMETPLAARPCASPRVAIGTWPHCLPSAGARPRGAIQRVRAWPGGAGALAAPPGAPRRRRAARGAGRHGLLFFLYS